jgi:hypothetical protein
VPANQTLATKLATKLATEPKDIAERMKAQKEAPAEDVAEIANMVIAKLQWTTFAEKLFEANREYARQVSAESDRLLLAAKTEAEAA